MIQYGIATFDTTFQALSFEKVMKAARIEIDLIPVPRKFSSSCGLAGRFNYQQKDEVVELCKEKGVEIAKIFLYEEEQKQGLLDKWFSKENK